MPNNTWRTIVTQPHDRLGLRDGQLILEDENMEQAVPIEQIRTLLLSSDKGSISLPLLTSLIEQNTAVIFCDRKYTPVGQLIGLDTNANAAGHLISQSEWT